VNGFNCAIALGALAGPYEVQALYGSHKHSYIKLESLDCMLGTVNTETRLEMLAFVTIVFVTTNVVSLRDESL
jgi:hypothetical protein